MGVASARLRLASLWFAQVARVLADNCLRMVVVLHIASAGPDGSQAAWHQTSVFFILPFLLLAPINGAISNGLPKRTVLVGSAAYILGVVVLLALFLDSNSSVWAWCAGLTVAMVGAAIFSPARYALMPAAAQDTRIPLPRVNGWLEMGGSAAVALALAIGKFSFAFPLFVLAMCVLSLLAALPVDFRSDVSRPEPVGRSLADFFRDFRRIVRDPAACGTMLALAAFLALALTGAGALLEYTGALRAHDFAPFLQALVMIGIGAAIGSLLASLQGHPRRALGLVPIAATGTILALVWAVLGGDLLGPSLVLGVTGGLVNAPLRAAYQAAVPADARGNGMAVSNAINYLGMIGLSALLLGLSHAGLISAAGQLVIVALLATAVAAVVWWLLFRDVMELVSEWLLMPFYRIHGYGPGLTAVPSRGPVLVVANHCAWLDPMWVAKVIPRHLYPMMTSDFYDRRGLRWLMKNVFQVIRVQASSFRRSAPELDEAIARLDRGGCVVIFPEGYLRRRAEPSVRMFGQGVWRILQARPETPVIVCWVEGGWGSYTSYAGGKPTKNKKMDLWRRIDVAVDEPQVLPADVLADSRATRIYLMRACLQARGYLGLEVPPLPELIEEETTAEEGNLA
jgi:1-acyl-sn-glycerol-3-phosphate acyltransferase